MRLLASRITTAERYRAALGEAFQRRQEAIAKSAWRVETLAAMASDVTESLEWYIGRFNSLASGTWDSRLRLELAVSERWATLAGHPVFMSRVVVRRPSSKVNPQPNDGGYPGPRELSRYFREPDLSTAYATVRALRAKARVHQAVVNVLLTAGEAITSIPDSYLADTPTAAMIPPPPYGSRLERMQHSQAQFGNAMATRIHAAGAALNMLDERLDPLIYRFNTIIKKRNRRGKIICRFDPKPPRKLDTCLTVIGPRFFSLSLHATRFTCVRTKPGSSRYHPQRNTVTRDLLERCYLGKYVSVYLPLAREIEDLRDKRTTLLRGLQNTIRALRSAPRLLEIPL